MIVCSWIFFLSPVYPGLGARKVLNRETSIGPDLLKSQEKPSLSNQGTRKSAA